MSITFVMAKYLKVVASLRYKFELIPFIIKR